ncbi:ubiquitin-specific protease [Trifolium repens]|nr:ubiquitin-specific protease [Trifolium repens]
MAETHLYTIKVARDEDLVEQIGKDVYFDLVDHEKVRSFRVQKDTSINVFKEDVAKEFGIPARFQRFWIWRKRQNHTSRPWRTLTHIEEAQSLAELVLSKVMGSNKVEYHLFLQVERGLDLCPIAPLIMRKDDILLFFKLYDPEKEELRYVGRFFVNCTGKPLEILTKLKKLAGYDPDEEIELYEEIKFEPYVMCEPVDKKLTFQENPHAELKHKTSAMDNVKLIRYPDVPSYLKYVRSRKVPFSSSDKESKDEESSEEQIKNIIDSKEIEAMIDEDVIAAIDRVLSEGLTIQFLRSIQASRRSLKVQELRDIVFKEDLFGKFKNDLTPEVIFIAVKEKIDVNAYAFSSRQLEQVSAVVNLLNNIVKMFEKLENLKKEQDSTKKIIDQDNEVLKVKRRKILASNTSFTNQQTQLNSLDARIADLKAKLEKVQGDYKAKIAEIQDQEIDKITTLKKEVKSIFHRLADDHIKLKSVEDKILEAQTDLESHEKLYQFFRANPPF